MFNTDDLSHNETPTHGHTIMTSTTDLNGDTSLYQDGIMVDHISHQDTDFVNGDFVINEGTNHNHVTQTIVNGKVISHSTINETGGEDIYHNGHLAYHTIPNGEGGVDIYDSNMHQVGMSVANGANGVDYISLEGNSQDILNYEDPLYHVHEYKMDKLDFNK